MRHWWVFFLLPVAILIYGFYLGAVSPAEQVKVLRLAHILNQHHPVHKGMQFMADDLWQRSGGRLRIDIYPDEQLGPERETIEMLQFGSLGMTKVSSGALESFSPKIGIFSLPYLFRDREHFWRVVDGEVGEELLDASLPYGLKGLCFYDAGARSFYLNKRVGKVVRSPEDLRGLTIRVMKSKTAVRMVEVLGANPVPIPLGELYSALDTGTVDGAENNLPSLHHTKQYEVSATFSLDEHTRIPDILMISVDVWNRLSDEERRWVKESARASSLYQRELWLESELESRAVAEQGGVRIIADVDKEAFRRRASAMYQDSEYQRPEMQDLIRRITLIR